MVASKPRKKPKTPSPPPSQEHSLVRTAMWIGGVLAVLLAVVWMGAFQPHAPESPPGVYIAKTEDSFLDRKLTTVPCASISKAERVEGCTPIKCGRFVVDGKFSDNDIDNLAAVALKWMALGGASGGVTILDLHSGALSYEDKFIDAYVQAESLNIDAYKEEDFELYRKIKDTIQTIVVSTKHFGITSDIFLTSPTFFSKIDSKPAVTEHDEYWHNHVDKITYGSFSYTCLLYLTSHGTNFTGGEFTFTDDGKEAIVQPKKGRLSCFSSGAENTHRITEVLSGQRLALTVAFTCDQDARIDDPNAKKAVATQS